MARCLPVRKRSLYVNVESTFSEGIVVSYVDPSGKEFRGILLSRLAKTHSLYGVVPDTAVAHDHNYFKLLFNTSASNTAAGNTAAGNTAAGNTNHKVEKKATMLPTFSNKFGVHSREIKTHLPKVSQNKVSTVTCDMTDIDMPGNHCNHPDTRKAKLSAMSKLKVLDEKFSSSSSARCRPVVNARKQHKRDLLQSKMEKSTLRNVRKNTSLRGGVKMKPFSVKIAKIHVHNGKTSVKKEVNPRISELNSAEMNTENDVNSNEEPMDHKELQAVASSGMDLCSHQMATSSSHKEIEEPQSADMVIDLSSAEKEMEEESQVAEMLDLSTVARLEKEQGDSTESKEELIESEMAVTTAVTARMPEDLKELQPSNADLIGTKPELQERCISELNQQVIGAPLLSIGKGHQSLWHH